MPEPSVQNAAHEGREDDYRMVTFADKEALRAYLDERNDAGEPPIAVGYDRVPQPFLITLDGPYGEVEAVFFDSPWAGHDIIGADIRCDECLGEQCGIGHLHFPVTVMTNGR